MEKFFVIFFVLLLGISPIFPTTTTHFERYLHVYEDESQVNKPLVIKELDSDTVNVISQRYKRDLYSTNLDKNLKNWTKVNRQTKLFFPLSVNASKSIAK